MVFKQTTAIFNEQCVTVHVECLVFDSFAGFLRYRLKIACFGFRITVLFFCETKYTVNKIFIVYSVSKIRSEFENIAFSKWTFNQGIIHSTTSDTTSNGT